MSRRRRSASSTLVASSLGLLAILLGSSAGCEFITRTDREEIPVGSGTGGMGGAGIPCTTVQDCPGTDTVCRTRTCTEGLCGIVDAPAGTATTNQTAKDCLREICDGHGTVTTEPDDADELDDDNDCTTDICAGGKPQNMPLGAGAPCTSNGGKVCDGAGSCVECATPSECPSNVCTAHQCVSAACADTVKNGSETDVDCGGPDCAPCADALACVMASDCASNVCTLNVCQIPKCSDGIENGTETDVDCGGSCAPCGPGLGCMQNSDCLGGACSGSTCLETCTDKLDNGNETDVDCGGPACSPCTDGDTCSVDADCASKICTNGLCAKATCMDMVQNGTETGIDCGGGTCDLCGDGLGCSVGSDCTSGVCIGMVCQAVTCADMVQNGTETDIDCGGGACPGCGLGDVCAVNGDCASDICVGGVCVVELCADGRVTGTEACDDGNLTGNDGCSSTCTVETGFTCTGTMPSTCLPICNDSLVVTGEPCDDGNNTDGDGCSATCAIETGYACTGAPSMCTSLCGDGIIILAETCDDGNIFGGDGCGVTCTIETGFTCTGAPTTCTPICGDSLIVGFEECDDANTNEDDGCDATCNVEQGFGCAGIPSVCTPIELEPNNACVDGSGPFAPPFVLNGRIFPAGDQDYIKVAIPAHADLKLETFAPALGQCVTGNDTKIELLSQDCMMLLASNDDEGINKCSLIDPAVDAGARNLAPGTYFVKVYEFENDSTISAYKLQAKFTALCGNGTLEGTEACDDGNLMPGDGCGSNCRLEPRPEVEPNDACAEATVLPAPVLYGASIIPATDKDFYAFTIPGYADIKLQTFAPTANTCTTGVDTVLQLRGPDCATVLATSDNGGVGTCSLIDPATTAAVRALPAGTYYVQVEENGNNATIADYQLLIALNSLCGDGVVQGTETCDDTNAIDGDGCTHQCRTEPGWTCTDSPSTCLFTCGDGAITGNEICDDVNMNSGDGCSNLCTPEPAYHCTGVPSTCLQFEYQCNDGTDNDNDGTIDSADSDCLIPPSFPACAVGQSLYVFTSIDVPKPIPDFPLPGPSSIIDIVGAPGTIARAAMAFTITHTYDADLDLFLIPPNGTAMDICSDNGGSEDNFTGTVLDSTCATAIPGGVAPFNGCYKPETSFASLIGTSPVGTWTFKAVDDLGGDFGTIQGWTMIFCVTP